MGNIFAGYPLDRAAHRRGEVGWLATALAHPDASAVVLRGGRVLVETPAGGGHRPLPIVGPALRSLVGSAEQVVFLGLVGDRPVLAVALSSGRVAEDLDNGAAAFADLLLVAASLDPREASLLGTARGLLEWNRRHGYCPVCGGATLAEQAGWRRRCPGCGAVHRPRLDPCVIMLPVFGARCLLGRHVSWPVAYSALAGFVEPGESLEEACAREVREEVGLVVTQARYRSTQPWPFPYSVMFGMVATVADDHVTLDPAELHEVMWLTRQRARDLLNGDILGANPPNPISIAYRLVVGWLEEPWPEVDRTVIRLRSG